MMRVPGHPDGVCERHEMIAAVPENRTCTEEFEMQRAKARTSRDVIPSEVRSCMRLKVEAMQKEAVWCRWKLVPTSLCVRVARDGIRGGGWLRDGLSTILQSAGR